MFVFRRSSMEASEELQKFTNRLAFLNSLFGFFLQADSYSNSTNVAFMEMQNICRRLSDFLQDTKTIWDMMTGYT